MHSRLGKKTLCFPRVVVILDLESLRNKGRLVRLNHHKRHIECKGRILLLAYADQFLAYHQYIRLQTKGHLGTLNMLDHSRQNCCKDRKEAAIIPNVEAIHE